MADEESHHRAVQEIVNRQRSSIAPFGVPPSVALPEPGPATDSVPYSHDMQPQLDQLRRPRRNRAALGPASTSVPSPPHADPGAPSTIVRSDTPLALGVSTAAAITKQELPHHPQSFTHPGVQEQPAETIIADPSSASDPAAPQVVHLEGRVTAGRASGRGSISVEPGRKSVKARPRVRTKVGRAVLKNAGEIELIGVSLVIQIDQRLKLLRLELERLNSDESLAAVDRAISDWGDLKCKLEAFLEAASRLAAKKTDDGAVTQKTCSLVEAIRDWLSKRHVQICDRVFDKALQAGDVGLFATVLGLCLLAGAGPDLSVAIPGAWFGGKPVVDAIKACLKPGRG